MAAGLIGDRNIWHGPCFVASRPDAKTYNIKTYDTKVYDTKTYDTKARNEGDPS